MEQMYDKEIEGIIVRSRARWYEHGEKNSKYFFNLEKRNHVRKHIRKLRLSGVITVDPFEILEGEKNFFMKIFINQEKIALTKTNYTFALKTCLFQHFHMNQDLWVKD